jgi:hypothetical protein
MERDGWVTSRQEREGGRPPRQVYAITPEGEKAFQQMLRESLSTHRPAEIPGATALNYLAHLSPPEAATLLRERRDQVAAVVHRFDAVPRDVLKMHPGMEYLCRYQEFELEWIDRLIAELSAPGGRQATGKHVLP